MFRELCVRVEPGKGEEFIMAYYNEFQRLIPVQEAQPFAINMELAKRGACSTTFVNVVTLLACVPGVLLSMFIYEYTLPEWTGVCITVLVMVMFSMLSTWYPAYRVTKVNPAVTLK